MALQGIDVASYQANINLDAVSFDFLIVKATESTTYVNPYCDYWYQIARRQGKKLGIYHFIDFGTDMIAQADFFVDNCRGYIGQAIFVLDWEGANVDRVGDALRFLQRVESRIGYKPAIYMSEWVENHYDWSSVVRNDNGLWLAKYADYEIDHNYDMSGAGTAPAITDWPFYFMWQWTSKGILNGYAGDLDCNIAYLTGDQWDLYAGNRQPAPTTTTTTQAPVEPTTTTTTTVEPTTTTTTTVRPEPTTTTTTVPTVTTTTTTSVPDGGGGIQPEPTWASIIVAIFIAIINRLRGIK